MYLNSPYNNPYQLSRNVVFGRRGMVASSHPLAAQIGLDILKNGGNAIASAVAVATSLTVMEPTSNGIGSDAFALIWYRGKLYGLNASGPAPRDITIGKVKECGFEKMPRFGFVPVTVPGAPAAWRELIKRFGNMSLNEVLTPAIDYAEKGYPVSPTTAFNWNMAYRIYKKNLLGPEYEEWFKVFAPNGRPPQAGEIWKSKDHANTLRLIAASNGEAFYNGKLADMIADFSKRYQGFITKRDLAEYEPQWVEPISVNYRGYDIWEIPPNGQGLVCLITLNILKGFDYLYPYNAKTVHKQIEAIKLGFAEGYKHITDIDEMEINISELLADEYANKLRQLISDRAMPGEVNDNRSGTVYFATADGEGNMVSYIQSNYMGFGSGLVVPGTGIALQNRGHTFSLNSHHINCLKPGKRTYHTIIPGFVTKNGKPVGPFGVMGGFMQPQGHLQVLSNCIDFKMNPQAALDAPRWQWVRDNVVKVEQRFPNHLIQELMAMGHHIQIEPSATTFGRGQIIWRHPDSGILMGGTESRTDGIVGAL